MKFEKDRKLLKYSIYVVGTAVAIYIAFGIMGNINSILHWVGKMMLTVADLLKTLIIAFVIAYLLHPIVHTIEKFLEKHKIFKKVKTRRSLGIILTYVLVLVAIGGLLTGVYFMIGGKLTNNLTINKIIENIMVYIKNLDFNVKDIETVIEKYNIPIPSNINEIFEKIVVVVKSWIGSTFNNTTEIMMNFSGNVVSVFIAIIISVYLLSDTEYFLDVWKKFYFLIFRKSKVGKGISKASLTVHSTFSNYLRGQFLDATIVGVLSAIALSIVGVDYAIVIGLIAGICNMIPYIGPIIGTVLAIIMALLSGDLKLVIWVIIAMVIVQQLDNNILAPKIVGDSVGLHPIFTMLAILIGGNLGGLIGMLLAVPLAASAKIIIKEWYENNIDYPVPLKLKVGEDGSEDKQEDLIVDHESVIAEVENVAQDNIEEKKDKDVSENLENKTEKIVDSKQKKSKITLFKKKK